MKILKINNRDYILKFTVEICKIMSKNGLTLKEIQESMKNFDLSKLYEAFYYSLKDKQPKITESEAYELLDIMFEEGKDGEELFYEIIEEYMKGLGFGTYFKKMKQEIEEKRQSK